MKNRALILLFAWLFISPINIYASAKVLYEPSIEDTEKDKIYNQQIVSDWISVESPRLISSFKKNGIYEARIYASPKRETLLITLYGKWWIENQRLYTTGEEIDSRIAFDINNLPDVCVDSIISISNDIMILLDSKGRKLTKKRIPPASVAY